MVDYTKAKRLHSHLRSLAVWQNHFQLHAKAFLSRTARKQEKCRQSKMKSLTDAIAAKAQDTVPEDLNADLQEEDDFDLNSDVMQDTIGNLNTLTMGAPRAVTDPRGVSSSCATPRWSRQISAPCSTESLKGSGMARPRLADLCLDRPPLRRRSAQEAQAWSESTASNVGSDVTSCEQSDSEIAGGKEEPDDKLMVERGVVPSKCLSDPVALASHMDQAVLLVRRSSLPQLPDISGLHDWPAEVVDLLTQQESSTAAQGIQVDPDRRSRGRRFKLSCAATQIPHPKKAESGGEDSLFLCSAGTAVGVADGVGEWAWRFGLNPRAFADELMQGACFAGESTRDHPFLRAEDRASRMLREGYGTTTSFGSATAIVAAMDPGGRPELGVASLGDSGLRVIRCNRQGGADSAPKIMHRTTEQQHSFNCPYQLSRLPGEADFPQLLAQGQTALVKALRSSPKQDSPQHADLYTFPVQEGDLVVLGSDGLFDNIHDHELCQLVALSLPRAEAKTGEGQLSAGTAQVDPQGLAKGIAQAAFLRSQDPTLRTPFSVHARDAGFFHTGGKMDDISVVVAKVVRA